MRWMTCWANEFPRMLKSLHLVNFTVFSEATLHFGKNLNVIVGENGTGKSHILKAVYAGLAESNDYLLERQRNPRYDGYFNIPNRLRKIFGAELEGNLVHRKTEISSLKESDALSISYQFVQSPLDFSTTIQVRDDQAADSLRSTTTVTAPPKLFVPNELVSLTPVFLPTRELLSIYPNFVSLYDSTHVPFEASWRDACGLLGKPYIKNSPYPALLKIQQRIEEAMGGTLRLDDAGRFYLTTAIGKIEMHMVAEGFRKLGMIAQLIANGSLSPGCTFLWDEPEANLNPRLIKLVATIITELSACGIQVFVATHSLFLLRELHILQKQLNGTLENRYLGLKRRDNGVVVKQGDTMDYVGELTALEEEVLQAECYMEVEMGLKPKR